MIKWDESYSTGQELIDLQHRQLFQFINQLNRAVISEDPLEQIQKHLEFLNYYVKSHFTYEESCMAQHHCPAAEKNKEAHDKFILFYQEFEQKINNEGCRPAHIAELHCFIEDWIVRHIKGIDTKLKPCLKSHQTDGEIT